MLTITTLCIGKQTNKQKQNPQILLLEITVTEINLKTATHAPCTLQHQVGLARQLSICMKLKCLTGVRADESE